MKTIVAFVLGVTIAAGAALAASGDVIYVHRLSQVTLSAGQKTSLGTLAGSVFPGIVLANLVSFECNRDQQTPSTVRCQAREERQLSPSSYIDLQLAGTADAPSGKVP